MKAVLGSKPWLSDPLLHPIPWRDHESHIHQDGRNLTVGVMWNDRVVTPAPAVTRCLQEVVERLKLVSGIAVIEWKPFRQKEALEILVSIVVPSLDQ